MHRKKFIRLAVGGATGTTGYLLSDKQNLLRTDLNPAGDEDSAILRPVEKEIVFPASLAPSGHNTQPWFVQYLEPYHWFIGSDGRRWLPAIDPEHRETLLSLGAFLKNVEFAASSFGDTCRWNQLATTNQDDRVMEVQLVKAGAGNFAHIESVKSRRTMRSGSPRETVRQKDLTHLVEGEPDSIHYLPASGKEAVFIGAPTIAAARLQASRDPAQQKLSDWLRCGSDDARKQRNRLTAAV